MLLKNIDKNLKKPTLDLAFFIANADSIFLGEENTLIDAYKNEMGLVYSPKQKSLNAILAAFEQASESDRRTVLFEMTALVVCDGTFSKDEKTVLNQIAKAWGIKPAFVTKAAAISGEVYGLYRQINKLICGPVSAKKG